MRLERRAGRESNGSQHFDEGFRVIAEAMPQLVWAARPDGTIDYLNRRWIEYTGVDLDELRRRSEDVGVIHPDELEETWSLWRDAIRSGEPYEQEYRIRNAADGSYRWFLGRAVPIRDDEGAIVQWIGTATDIDDRQRARDHLRFMVEAGNVFAAPFDVDRICRDLARAAVGEFADWCFVTLASEGRFVTRAIAHKDQTLQEYVEQYRDRYPPDAQSALGNVVRTNEPLLVERVRAEQLEASASDAEHLRLLRMLEMHSVMIVPLSAPGEAACGAVTMMSSESRRLFSDVDLSVAQTVAGRAAVAIHNARAYQEERRAADILRLTGRANQLLFETADPWQSMEQVARMVASEVADACAILRLAGDTARTEFIVHRDAALDAALEPLRGHRTLRLDAEKELAGRLKQHRTIVLTEDTAKIKERSWQYLWPSIEALNANSTVIVPWHTGSATYGALVAHYAASRVDPHDVALLEEIARRAAVAVERAETLERERNIATTLQQASLPSIIAEPQGLAFDAVYAPAGEEAQVGGDWYDAIELDDGSVVVSVGDVTGRGIQAAAIMSKVRHAMGMAPLHEPDPTRILDSAGWFLGKRYPNAIVTAFVGIIAPDRRTMRFANAGHPLPILRRDGRLVELCAAGLPLGLRHLAAPTASGEIELQPSDIVLFFTDGLIEGRRDWKLGEKLVQDAMRSDLFAATASPARLLARSCLPRTLHDDVAILAVTVAPQRVWSLSLDDARAASDARSQFVDFLWGRSKNRAFVNAAELIFGELLGNVVCHAPGPVEITVDWLERSILLHVIDSGPPIPVTDWRLPDDTLSERGRGLFIIAQLGAALRVEHVVNTGNHVSVEIPRDPA